MKVPEKFDGATLLDCICGILPHTPKETWESEFDSGRFLDNEKNRAEKTRRVRKGERYLHLIPASSEPDVNADIRILYEDLAIIVVNKPAPLPVHPSGRFNRNTLQYILSEAYHPGIPRPAHRLDANTTGLIVFARSRHFAGLLQPQFHRGEVKKTYLARVQGHPSENSFSCDAPISEGPIELGAREIDEKGLPALTHFTVLERFLDGTSLLECRPVTGRTNQIRVHLWNQGFPICGEQVYLHEGKIGVTQTQSVSDVGLKLHSYKISFTHPKTGKEVSFTCEPDSSFHGGDKGRPLRDFAQPLKSSGVIA